MEYGFERLQSSFAGYRLFVHGVLEVPLHWHDHLEILVVLKGAARVVVDGQDCRLSQNDLIIINAHSTHNSICEPDTVLCGIHIDVEHMEAQGLAGFSQRYFQCKSFLYAKDYRERVIDPMRALIARTILAGGDPEDVLLSNSLVGLLCCHIYRHVPWTLRNADTTLNEDGRLRIGRIMQQLRASPGNLTLEHFARCEALSVPHLSRLFRRYLGIGFREYVQNVRLDRAVIQLRNTKQSIADIALNEGFSSGSLFYSKFRDRFGCTPAEYRRRASFGAGLEAPSYGPLLTALADESSALSSDLLRLHCDRQRIRINAPHQSAGLALV